MTHLHAGRVKRGFTVFVLYVDVDAFLEQDVENVVVLLDLLGCSRAAHHVMQYRGLFVVLDRDVNVLDAEQQQADLERILAHAKVQRRPAVHVAHVDVRALAQQESDDLAVAVGARGVERRLEVGVELVDVGGLLDELAELGDRILLFDAMVQLRRSRDAGQRGGRRRRERALLERRRVRCAASEDGRDRALEGLFLDGEWLVVVVVATTGAVLVIIRHGVGGDVVVVVRGDGVVWCWIDRSTKVGENNNDYSSGGGGGGGGGNTEMMRITADEMVAATATTKKRGGRRQTANE